MGTKVTLGGDRIGMGRRNKVELNHYERSTHNLSTIWRSTMSVGTLVPCMCSVALPEDTWDIELDMETLTKPTVGPLFGSMVAEAHFYLTPMRLYIGKLHNNALNIGRKMSDIKLPKMSFIAEDVRTSPNIDISQINPSCILAYLGLRGIGSTTENVARDFNAIPLLAYWDIVKNYYTNKQEENAYVLHTALKNVQVIVDTIEVFPSGTTIPVAPGTGAYIPLNAEEDTIVVTKLGAPAAPTLDRAQVMLTLWPGNQRVSLADIGELISEDGTNVTIRYDQSRYGNRTTSQWSYIQPNENTVNPVSMQAFPLEDIDKMREDILAWTPNATAFDIFAQNRYPYEYLTERNSTFRAIMNTQEGLAVKTYKSDLFNNWLNTEWIDGPDGINEITKIDTTDGLYIDTFLLAKKTYDMLYRIAISDGTYKSWLETMWDTELGWQAETPMYSGGIMKELVFQEVVSNSEAAPTTEGGAQPLGTLAGKGRLLPHKEGGKMVIKVSELSYIIGIVSITPRIDYSQGNNFDMILETIDDFHKPAMDGIGFQELITEQMAWWNTRRDTMNDVWVTKSAGKIPAWSNYRTNINKNYGNFAIAESEMFMVLNRRYTPIVEDQFIEFDDLTTYIDPAKYNHIFAQTSLDSQNFWMNIGIHATVRRKMGAKVIPNL